MYYKLLSALLDYPTDEMLDALPELRDDLREYGLEAGEWLVVEQFIDGLAGKDSFEAQSAFVQTFDLTPEHALHLTHHLFGDDKNRGPALIDLTEYYKSHGLDLAANDGNPNELPDYLPLILEFCAQLDAAEAREFLSQWGKVLNQLASNLEKAESPYAPLIRLVERRSQLLQAAA